MFGRTALPFSLRISATVTADLAVMILTSTAKPGLEPSAIFIIDSSVIAKEWLQLAKMTYMNAERLDSNDGGFVPAPVCSSLGCDSNDNRFPTQYNQRDEMFPVMSVFVSVVQLSDRLDT